jgi:hypothetical protein
MDFKDEEQLNEYLNANPHLKEAVYAIYEVFTLEWHFRDSKQLVNILNNLLTKSSA